MGSHAARRIREFQILGEIMISAPFSKDEYNCLKPDLSGPEAMWDRIESERMLKTHEDNATNTRNRFLDNKDLRQSIEDEILEKKQVESDDITALRETVEALRNLKFKQKSYGKEYGKAFYIDLMSGIRDKYCSFDIERFKKDFSQAFPSVRLTDQEKSHRKSEREAEKQRNKIDHDYDWKQHFKIVPNSWRGMSIKNIGKDSMAERICRKFIQEWTERQSKFIRAVTITGILIDSLPDMPKELWTRMWKKFDLDKIKRAEIFSYTLFKQEKAALKPAPESIPATFHEAN